MLRSSALPYCWIVASGRSRRSSFRGTVSLNLSVIAVVGQLHTKLNPGQTGKHDLNYDGRDKLASLLKQADPDNRGTQPAAITYYDDLSKRIIDQRSKVGIFTNMQQVTSTEGV